MASYHHGNLRASLIDEAIKQLESHSDCELSLRQLAIATGVSNNAPYRHFKNKQALLDCIAEEGVKRLCAVVETASVPPSFKPDPLQRAAQAYIEFAQQHTSLYQLMFAPAVTDETPSELGDTRGVLIALFCRMLVAENPHLTESSQHFAACCVLSYLHGIASLSMNQAGLIQGSGHDLLGPISGLIDAIQP